jgi:O-antigen/teichoic acid export membrane protein
MFSKRYLVTLLAGYSQMIVMIVISLAQVPLVLSYLGKSQFAIWALAAQACIWLQLVDGGMNGALSRFLIDYKTGSTEQLQKCLSTGSRVLCAQGILVFLVSLILGFCGESAFGLTQSEGEVFIGLMTLLGLSAGIGFCGKVAQSWLYGAQRLDIANIIGLVLAVLDFLIFWFLLNLDVGIKSLAISRLIVSVIGVVITWWISVKWVGFPWSLLYNGWDKTMFQRLASFGGGMFLLTLGGLLLSMTQTAMTARLLGLTAAAVWATAPKVFMLTQQLVCKVWDYKIPYLSQLMADGSYVQISKEFLSLFRVVAYLAGGIGGLLAAVNPSFLKLWTVGHIEWDSVNNLLMAACSYSFLLVRCFTDFVLHTKKVGIMPLLMLIEGVLYVAACFLLMPKYGFFAMLSCSLLISGILRLPYAWVCMRAYLGFNTPELRRLVSITCSGAMLGLVVYFLLRQIAHYLMSYDAHHILIFQFTFAALLALPIFIKVYLSIKNNKSNS